MSDQIADIVKNHLESFSSSFGNTITRSIDHLVAQQEKASDYQQKLADQAANQDRRIDRLEIIVENTNKQVDSTNKQVSEVLETVKAVTTSITEIATRQSSIDHDRQRHSEEVDALYHKMDLWQQDCAKKHDAVCNEVAALKTKVQRIYITVTVFGAIAAIVAQVVSFFVNLSKL